MYRKTQSHTIRFLSVKSGDHVWPAFSWSVPRNRETPGRFAGRGHPRVAAVLNAAWSQASVALVEV